MTIFYPDLSHYDLNRGVTVAPDTVAVFAKATHGALFLDSGYTTIKAQAAKQGAIFGGYHWLNHGSVDAQAAYCYSQIGATPVMVDAEDMPGNSGYNGPLTVADITGFVTALRAKGGICNLVYLPRWVWQNQMGSPDLTPLARLGVGLVSSNYSAYSDTGPGWTSYGGMTPVVWQYTDALPYGGSTCDFNAFRGTVDEFRALLEGADMTMTPMQDVELFNAWKVLEAFRAGTDTVQQNTGIDATGKIQPFDVFPVKAIKDVAAQVGALSAKVDAAQAVGAPTQAQVNAAVLAAMLDPRVQKGIGDVIAAHMHVS